MTLLDKLEAYQPFNEQEACDKAQLLDLIRHTPACLEGRHPIGHLTASMWTVNRDFTRTLMVYHNLYDSWSWIGGHADGEMDLCAVALRELQEETGLCHARLVSPEIFSLETLTVNGHRKRGVYVPGHLHFNLTYLAMADEHEPLRPKPDENKAVRWFTMAEALTVPNEQWMVENVYRKLIDKCMHVKTTG